MCVFLVGCCVDFWCCCLWLVVCVVVGGGYGGLLGVF